MKAESKWKKFSNWRKAKAEQLKSIRFMARFGFPIENPSMRRRERNG